jgi:hemolysin activation/secretion protein
VLAGQVYTEAVIGEAPFQLLPLLGGSNRMRGYREGRLRDDVYWTVQVEYRFPLFWRFKGTAFASAGEVGPRIGAPLVNGVETAVGLGGRLRLTEDGVHGRLDLAYSRTGLELYISLGEAF